MLDYVIKNGRYFLWECIVKKKKSFIKYKGCYVDSMKYKKYVIYNNYMLLIKKIRKY